MWVHLSTALGREVTKVGRWLVSAPLHPSQTYKEHDHMVSARHLHPELRPFFSPIVCIYVCIQSHVWDMYACGSQR